MRKTKSTRNEKDETGTERVRYVSDNERISKGRPLIAAGQCRLEGGAEKACHPPDTFVRRSGGHPFFSK